MGYIEGVSPDGVPCRVYATAGKESQGAFALDCCGKVLSYFSKYFGRRARRAALLFALSRLKTKSFSHAVSTRGG